jgi:hypothetical protein
MLVGCIIFENTSLHWTYKVYFKKIKLLIFKENLKSSNFTFSNSLNQPNSSRKSLLTLKKKKEKTVSKYIFFIAQIEVNYENYYLVCGILISICNSNIIVIVYVKF